MRVRQSGGILDVAPLADVVLLLRHGHTACWRSGVDEVRVV
jgi:hypothetical protein